MSQHFFTHCLPVNDYTYEYAYLSFESSIASFNVLCTVIVVRAPKATQSFKPF
jgi:hypothetical protein